VARTSTLPKRLQPMLATLTDAPFDDKGWVFEDKYDGFRMVAKTDNGKVTLYSRNGQIISKNYVEVARVLEGAKGDAVIDGELIALDQKGISYFQLLQNALRQKAKLQYRAFDLMFQDGEDLRGLPLLERKKRLKSILPKHRLIAFSHHRAALGTKFFEEADWRWKHNTTCLPCLGRRWNCHVRRACGGGRINSRLPPERRTVNYHRPASAVTGD
jgi:bifunctional non-homologous end joining protein LigD